MSNVNKIVIIAFVSILSACGTETINPTYSLTATVHTTPLEKTGSPAASTGDEGDEEDPIIQGAVLSEGSAPITNGQVALIPFGSGNPVATMATDGNGQFQFVEQPGTYYFQVILPNQATTVSDTLTIQSDVWVDLQLD